MEFGSLDMFVTPFIRITAILGLTFIACYFLRNGRAGVRYTLWKLAFVAVIFSILTPALYQVNLVASEKSSEVREWVAPYEQMFSPPKVQSESAIPLTVPKSLVEDSNTKPVLHPGWLWLLGVLFLLIFRLVTSISWVRRVTKNAVALPFNQAILHSTKVRALGFRPSVFISGEVTVPVTFGLFRPKIILPIDAVDWDPGRLQIVLLHEYIHISRGDLYVNVIVELCKILCWFHPLIWMACLRISEECEKTCDEQVLMNGIPKTTYASVLLSTARALSPPRNPMLVLNFAKRSALRGRFEAILNPKPDRNLWRYPSYLLFLMASFALVNMGFRTSLPDWETMSLESLDEALGGPNSDIVGALQEICRRNEKDLARSVSGLLYNSDPEIRASAARTLGTLRDDNALSSLLRNVSDDHNLVKEQIVLAIAEFGYRHTFYSIQPLAQHQNREVRLAAIWALYQIGCLPAFATVSQNLHDEDPKVRDLALRVLEGWNRDRLTSWLQTNAGIHGEPIFYQSLDQIEEWGSVDFLIQCLSESSGDMQVLSHILIQQSFERASLLAKQYQS